jgi:hypothetical protein
LKQGLFHLQVHLVQAQAVHLVQAQAQAHHRVPKAQAQSQVAQVLKAQAQSQVAHQAQATQ